MHVTRTIGRIWWLSKILMIAGAGAGLALIGIATVYLMSQENLSVWHTETLTEEFTGGADVSTFEEYLALEDRLFRELDDKIIKRSSWGDSDEINRFQPSSVSNPARWPRNWNRSFLLEAENPRASVLLLHGMSDSPYSLRSVGEALHQEGMTVLGLRIPGHGTAPSGLLDVTWQDMFAATELGVKHLHKLTPDRPIYLVGYSNGAALAVLYALMQVGNSELPKVARVSLLSPAIGITPAAAYAEWLIELGHVLGLQKLAWSSVLPEYDPFKYSSFTVNAGYVTYQLTQQVQLALDAVAAEGKLRDIPPIQGFSSVVDATVRPPDLVANLFNRLPENGSELILFDINRAIADTPLFSFDPEAILKPLTSKLDRAYSIHLITNADMADAQVMRRSFSPGSRTPDDQPLDLFWPGDIYSLSHIALPFRADDPLYGHIRQPDISKLQLGSQVLRGEKTILNIPASDVLRIHWNPFHTLMISEIRRFLPG